MAVNAKRSPSILPARAFAAPCALLRSRDLRAVLLLSAAIAAALVARAGAPASGDADAAKVRQVGCEQLPYAGAALESASHEDVRGGRVCRYRIHADLPVFTFRLLADPARNVIERIEVRRGEDAAPFQTLRADMDDPAPRGGELFTATDINSDGYLDVRLLAWWGATGNKGHQYWLFAPDSGTFVECPALRDLSNAEADAATRTVSTRYNGGHAGKIYGRERYTFAQDGALELVYEDSQDWNAAEKCYVRKVREKQAGRWVEHTDRVAWED